MRKRETKGQGDSKSRVDFGFLVGYSARLLLLLLVTAFTFELGLVLRPHDGNPWDLNYGATMIRFVGSEPGMSVQVTKADLRSQTLVVSMSVPVPSSSSKASLYIDVSGITPNALTSGSKPDLWAVGSDSAGRAFDLRPGDNFLVFFLKFQACGCSSQAEPYLSVRPLQISEDNAQLWQQKVDFGSDAAAFAKLSKVYGDGVHGQNAPGKPAEDRYAAAAAPIEINSVTPPWLAGAPNFSLVATTPAVPDDISSDGYTWDKKGGESVTVLDASRRDSSGHAEFYSGVLFGVTGGAFIAFIVEVFNFYEGWGDRKRNENHPESTVRRESEEFSREGSGGDSRHNAISSSESGDKRGFRESVSPKNAESFRRATTDKLVIGLGGLLGAGVVIWFQNWLLKNRNKG